MSTQRYRCVAEVAGRSGRLSAVLGVLEDALALGLARLASVPEGDLDGDLVLAHELVADGAADGGDDVLLGVDSLGLLAGVCHDGRLLAAARDAWTDARRHDGFRISFGIVRLAGASQTAKATVAALWLPCAAVPRRVHARLGAALIAISATATLAAC